MVVRTYLSRDAFADAGDILLHEEHTGAAIPQQQEVEVMHSVSAPQTPGAYHLIVWVNPDNSFDELLHTNNQSLALPLTVGPRYAASAEVSDVFYSQGALIPITGKATLLDGSPAAHETLEITITVNGVSRRFETKTDAGGEYRYDFVPLANEAGSYGVTAGYPGTMGMPDQATFDIIGIQVEDGKPLQFPVILGLRCQWPRGSVASPEPWPP
ncbi:carboxypeptidase-like regulatory domain-containing protein [Parapedobacter soli]|uniref:carboxypeptidase-like regulatory domain-containing protein n=1 Tax=Parapedobacter soli TaxID=416955 RepID=UPI0021C93D84|nr:carboxypeptidase-like regulatory domain-containing protein [Parapedobacter soli]